MALTVATGLALACSSPREEADATPRAEEEGAADTEVADVSPWDARDDLLPEELAGPKLETLCDEIGGKLGSVSVVDCLARDLWVTRYESVRGRPLVRRDDASPGDQPPWGRVLVLGGIHGDEYSSVSIVFRWMRRLERDERLPIHWRFLPVANPDGLLQARSQRMNARGVDLNRNFPTENWEADAQDYWVRRTSRNARRYPGTAPLSEPESQFIDAQLRAFAPDIVVAVHAPLEVVDFDGRQTPPEKLGALYLKRLGTFPGSLGRYGSERLRTPVLTLELPSAGIMPDESELDAIWQDLQDYLRRSLGPPVASPGVTG